MSADTTHKVPVTINKNDGTKIDKNVNVRVLRMDKTKVKNVERALDATSNLSQDSQKYYNQNRIITPPYDPLTLIQLEEESNVLRECIDAMVVNTVSFGYHFRPRKMTTKMKESSDMKELLEDEEIELQTFFDTICLEDRLLPLNQKLKRDHELIGNAFIEVVRVPGGKITELVYAPGHLIRLVRQDDKPTPYTVKKVIVKDSDFKIVELQRQKYFRRFVQVDSSGKIQTWFKEFGDPRNIDKNTGEVTTDTNINVLATEIIHHKVDSARTPYGIPRWISRIVDIKGSRRASEVNYFTLSNNHVPTLFIMVENGTLSDGSVNRLSELIETQVGDDPNHGKIVIIESEGVENNFGISEASAGKVKIKNVKEAQHGDQLYQDYDKNSRKRTRSSFRLAPLHTGDTDDYSHASVKEARRVTDEQVFAPSRDDWAQWLNDIVVDQDYKYHMFKFNTPNITDNEILVSMIRELEKVGAMTPKRGNKLAEDVFEGELGPMPEGIDENVPFSLQFAKAQNAGKLAQQESKSSSDSKSQDDMEEDDDMEDDFARSFVEEVMRMRQD